VRSVDDCLLVNSKRSGSTQSFSCVAPALVAILQSTGDHQALGAFSHETVEAAVSESVPAVIIVDASHPEATALVAVARAHAPKASVVILSMHELEEEFLAWADIGIAGYLGPDISAQDLLSTVRRVGAGEVICPPRLTALLLNRFANRSTERAARASVHALTSREHEIAGLLADGMSNKLIARRLQVALPTVKNHVHSILEKWDVRSRGEAAARYSSDEPGGQKAERRHACGATASPGVSNGSRCSAERRTMARYAAALRAQGRLGLLGSVRSNRDRFSGSQTSFGHMGFRP